MKVVAKTSFKELCVITRSYHVSKPVSRKESTVKRFNTRSIRSFHNRVGPTLVERGNKKDLGVVKVSELLKCSLCLVNHR